MVQIGRKLIPGIKVSPWQVYRRSRPCALCTPAAQPPPKGQLQVRRWLGGFGTCPIQCLESRNWFYRLATTNLLCESISHICSVRGSKVISHVVYCNTTRRALRAREVVRGSGSASSPLNPFIQNPKSLHGCSNERFLTEFVSFIQHGLLRVYLLDKLASFYGSE